MDGGWRGGGWKVDGGCGQGFTWQHGELLSGRTPPSSHPQIHQMTRIQSTNAESLLPSADSHEIRVPSFDSWVKNGEDIDRPDFDKHSSRHNSAHNCFTLNSKVEIELCPENDSDEEG